MIDKSNFEYMLPLVNPTVLAYRGNGFNWSDLRQGVTNGDYYYSFVTSTTKCTVIYNRALDCAEGTVRLDLIASPTSFTPGAASNSTNLFIGRSSPDLVITRGASNVVGGVSTPPNNPVAFLGTAGNNAPVSGSAGQPTIFPPGVTFVAKINSNVSGGSNAWINFALSYAEVYIPPHLYS